MRQTILIAAIALGSGCILSTSSNEGDVTLYWSQWDTFSHGRFGSAGATATDVCRQVGVKDISIVLIDPDNVPSPAASGPCITSNDVPGIVFVGLRPGRWSYEITGFRGSAAVFRYAHQFDVFVDTNTVEDAFPMAQYGDLVLGVTVTPACSAGDWVDFDVVDTGTGAPVFSTSLGTTNPPFHAPCAGLTVPSVPAGSYKLANLAQANAGGPVAYPSCIPNWTQPTLGTALAVTIDSATAPGGSTYCPPG